MAEELSAFDALLNESKLRTEAIAARKEAAPAVPSIRSICLDLALYSDLQLNPKRDENFLGQMKFGAVQFDAHCVYCSQSATFRTMGDRADPDYEKLLKAAINNDPAKAELKRLKLEGGQFAIHVICSRRPDHLYSYFFTYNAGQGILTKIGQVPSLEDVAGIDIERYRKILGSDFAELRRATGLFAHGIGIGAFVYLRRIFENLVETARKAADPDGTREAELMQMRMSERVQALSGHLPPAVVKYKDAYSILSKGLHELSEAECKQYFPVVRLAIINMLEQRYEAEQKAKAATDLDRAMASIMSGQKGNE